MPSGKVHRAHNLRLLPYLVILSMFHTRILVVCIAYLFSTILMNPDQDMDGTKSDKAFFLWDIFWNPYSWLFEHRKAYKMTPSHWHVFGTLTRAVYLVIGIAFLIVGFNKWVIPSYWMQDMLYSEFLNRWIDGYSLSKGLSFKVTKAGMTINYILISMQTLVDIGIGLIIVDGYHIELDRAVSMEKMKAKAGILKNIRKTFGL